MNFIKYFILSIKDNSFENSLYQNSMFGFGNANLFEKKFNQEGINCQSLINNKKDKVVYIFNILKSRKKEKKYLRKKYNKVISRVHNMDCLLKKIKA